MARQAHKHQAILNDLRRQIIAGEFVPGQRLPTRAEIERHFKASSVTVQRTLDRLAADGFVCARGRQGTFLADRPPHLFRYGLVLPGALADEPRWPHFWRALRNEALALQSNRGLDLPIFCAINGREHVGDHQRLVRDVESRRLAGLILVSEADELAATPIITNPDIPRIAINEQCAIPDLSLLRLEMAPFFDQALDHLVARGCRRIALLTVPGIPRGLHRHFLTAVARRGLRSEPHWQQAVEIGAAGWARQVCNLLLRQPASDRPDGLVITDDNLVEQAMHGLADAGTDAGQVAVVGHCNFPWPTPSRCAIKRIGFNVRDILLRCIEHIDQRRGRRAGATIIAMHPDSGEVGDAAPPGAVATAAESAALRRIG